MRRIKRLLSFAMTGALILGIALTGGFIGESAFSHQRAFAEASEDGSEGEAAPSEERESEEAPEQKAEEEKTSEEAPEQKAKEESAPEEAPEQKEAEEASREEPEQKEEEKAASDEEPEQKAEEVTSGKEPEQKAEEVTSGKEPEQKEEEKAASDEEPEQKAEEQAPKEVTGQKAKELTSGEETGQKKVEEKADDQEAEYEEDDVELTLSIANPGGLSMSDGAYRVDPAQVSALTLAWECRGECDAFEVSVSGGVYSGTTHDTALKLSVGALSAGKYTATVKAIRGGKTAAKAKLSFRILPSVEAADAARNQQESEKKPEEEGASQEQVDQAASDEDAVPGAPDPEQVQDEDIVLDLQEPLDPTDVLDPADKGMDLDVQIDLDAAGEATDPETVDPEAVSLSLTIAAPQGLTVTDGVYQVDPSQVDALTIAWECSGECDGYAVSVSGGVHSGETSDTALTLSVAQLAAGKYTVTVEALKDGKVVARAQLVFQITDAQQQSGGDQQPEGGMPTGGMPTGSAPKGGGAQGAMAEEEQGFHVTPGEALTATHTSGNGDMRLYDAVALTLDAEAEMTELTLGGTSLGVMLDGGRTAFTGSIEGNTLTLTAGNGKIWTLNGRALKTLSSSGIEKLVLRAGGINAELATARVFQGSIYARLCGEGFVSADYNYQISDAGIVIAVAGSAYRVGDAGELIPLEGDGNAETMVYSASDAA